MNPNNELPKNLQDLIANLTTIQAVPLGTEQGIPFLAVKITENDEALLRDNAVTCEFKPSMFNIDYKDETIALCVVMFRINGNDRLNYTATYDLAIDKQYSDCHDLLGMRQYGLLIATGSKHIFLQFDTNFVGTFNPQQVLSDTRNNATGYDPILAVEAAYALTHQTHSPAQQWAYLEEIAPALHRWYARFTMQAEKVE